MLRLQNEFAYACACTMPLGSVAQLVYVYACTYVCAHTHVRMFAPKDHTKTHASASL